jgi:hypothetical protein
MSVICDVTPQCTVPIEINTEDRSVTQEKSDLECEYTILYAVLVLENAA